MFPPLKDIAEKSHAIKVREHNLDAACAEKLPRLLPLCETLRKVVDEIDQDIHVKIGARLTAVRNGVASFPVDNVRTETENQKKVMHEINAFLFLVDNDIPAKRYNLLQRYENFCDHIILGQQEGAASTNPLRQTLAGQFPLDLPPAQFHPDPKKELDDAADVIRSEITILAGVEENTVPTLSDLDLLLYDPILAMACELRMIKKVAALTRHAPEEPSLIRLMKIAGALTVAERQALTLRRQDKWSAVIEGAQFVWAVAQARTGDKAQVEEALGMYRQACCFVANYSPRGYPHPSEYQKLLLNISNIDPRRSTASLHPRPPFQGKDI